MVDRHMLILLY